MSETITVSDRVVALAASQVAIQLQEQRTRIRQPGKIVSDGGIFGLSILQCILDRQRHLAADREQDAQVIGGECIALATIESEHADDAGDAFKRHRQCRA